MSFLNHLKHQESVKIPSSIKTPKSILIAGFLLAYNAQVHAIFDCNVSAEKISCNWESFSSLPKYLEQINSNNSNDSNIDLKLTFPQLQENSRSPSRPKENNIAISLNYGF